ncbi:MAG: hypothetical protein OT477_16055 [Chloroflexi bacterium]|nr:hypothetical protein [Chloroflexota bacterium]
MSNEEKRLWSQVYPVAEKLRDALASTCHELVIAGSLRRKKPMVADIELVALPILDEAMDLFGKVVSSHNHLLARLDKLAEEKKIVVGRAWGTAYRKFYMRSSANVEYAVDVFVAKRENFGNTLAIRTGSAEFSAGFMAHINRKGMKHDKGYLHSVEGVIIPCRTEEGFFATIDYPCVPPELRSGDEWQPLVAKWEQGATI